MEHYTFTCGECGCQFGRPARDPADDWCDDCRWKKDRQEEIHYIIGILKSARYFAQMHNVRELRTKLKQAREEIQSLEKFLR